MLAPYKTNRLTNTPTFLKETGLFVVALFVLLLLIFYAAFFGLDQVTQALGIASNNSDILLTTVGNYQVSLSRAAVRIFLGGGIVVFQLLIIVMSVFDRIMDTIKATVRPVATLVPLVAFLFSVYNTFRPIIENFLGGDIESIAQSVNDPSFTQQMLVTFGLMVLFLVVAAILGGESAEMKRMRSELQRLKKGKG